MASYDYDLGVIGAGAAGLTLTAGAAQMGAKTLLVEARNQLGGDCLHFGCVPSKTLIRSAHVYWQMKNGSKFGLPEFSPPPVDFSQISKRIQNVIVRIQKHDSVERFCALGARIEFGLAEFLDEHHIRLNGRRISAQKWAIATGASPVIPPIKGLAQVRYLTNETIFYQSNLPAEMIILGGGPVAVEMGQALNRLGCRITIIQRNEHIMSQEDPDMALWVQKILENEGIRVYAGVEIQEVREENGLKRVIALDRQGKERVFKARDLFLALGRQANVHHLKLERAGVYYTDEGILVDHKMRTSQKHIFAIGDITGCYPFTHAAGYEAGVALSNAIIHYPRKADYTWMPRVTYTDPELAVMGKTEAQLRADGTDYVLWSESFENNDRSLAEGYPIGKIKLLLDKSEKVLGVQILGPRAGELLGEWVAVLNGGIKLSTLASAVHPYPTLTEINKQVAADVMAPKIFGGFLKKGVNLVFNYKGRACELGSDRD